jgi:precorrin-2/cobalt-factor-2 C20-methyltransferase
MARFYAIGVGPGDPELLTRKGERILRSVNAIVAPVARPGETSVALETVRELIDPTRQDVLPFLFPMTTDRSLLEPAWHNAADEITGRIARGEDVAFITIGDPLFYATSIYLLELIAARQPDIDIEIVPGITSFCAAAAVGRYRLTERDELFAVVPATSGIDAVAEALDRCDTVVLLKIKPLFPEIMSLLKQRERTSDILFAERVGTARQVVLHDFDSIAAHSPDYLSLLISGKQRRPLLPGSPV